MAGLTTAAVRVKALQPSRRRAGFAFTSTPRDLSRDELGEGIEGLKRLCMLFNDPALSVSFVDDDGQVHALTEEQKGELQAYVAAEELRVDPANPPAPITELQTLGGSRPEAEGADAQVVSGPTGDGGEKAPDTIATDNPAEASKPVGEETASPAAEATGNTKSKRGKAGSAGA